MNLFYLTHSRIPTEKAHGLQIVRMCEAFASGGVSVTLVVPKRKNHIVEDIFSYYETPPTFTIVYVPILDTVSMGKYGYLFSLLQFTILSGIYVWFKKGVIFTRDELVAAIGLILRKKVFWESHTGSWNSIVRFVSRYVQKVVVISKGLRTFYLEQGVPLAKIHVAPDGVRIDDFIFEMTKQEARKELYLPDTHIVMYTGHLYDWKGVDTLAKAAMLLPEIDFVFIGGTEVDIKRFSKKYSTKNVHILGHKKHSEIPFFLRAADIVVLPNSANSRVSKTFTSPMKLFEYMASGTPIIASDLPSIREIVSEEAVFFTIPDNPDTLAESIRYCFNNQSLMQEKAETALKVVYSYTWNQRARDIASFF